jgi:predicted alpha/beta hydrolase
MAIATPRTSYLNAYNAVMPHAQPVIAVESADGHRFELIHIPAATPDSTLLLLPGMGLSARQYISFGQALAERSVEVFIHEWRGLGASSLRAGRNADWGYRELLDFDLGSALAEVRKVVTDRPLIIAGHSLGAQLACLLAASHPQKADGIVIVAGGSPYWKKFPMHKGLPLYAGFHLMPLIARIVGHYPGRTLGFAGREARSVVSDWALSGSSGRYQPPDIDRDLEAEMATLTIPVLGLRMEMDWFVPEASLTWLLKKMPRCTITSQIVKASDMQGPADHYGWMTDPGATVECIGEWLETPNSET